MADHTHDHGHDHGHDHSHNHPLQADHAEPETRDQFLGLALNALLIEKGIYTADEIRSTIETIEMVSPETHGARVVAKAWADPDFKAALLEDGFAAVKNIGLDPGYAELTVLENTPDVHNVVVCTLCSCYPRSLLGRPPVWYKSGEFRARVVREPRSVLTEFGLEVDDDTEVRVHDSNAELRYIVLPMRPAGTDGWGEDALTALVSRDCMIGVAVPKAS